METEELLQKVRKIEIKTKGLSNNIFAGEYHSAFKGRGMAFSEVREYQYGDDVRDIDWNVTARFGKPFVKVFEEERELTVMLLVDVSGSLDFGTRKHILFIIRELLTFQPESQKTDVGQAVEFMTNAIKKRCTVFLLSDFFDQKDYTSQLTIANSRHDVVALQIYDRRMVELPDVGIVKMMDAETGGETFIDTSSSAVRRAHHEWWVSHQGWLKNAFTKSNIDHISVRTDEDYVRALMNLFRRRS